MQTWSLFIDVEGFSSIYKRDQARGLKLLSIMGEFIYETGNKVYPNVGERLFAYQLGDGFVIVPERVNDSKRAISIAMALMRCFVLSGGVARAAVATGSISDVLSCFSFAKNGKSAFPMGEGLMVLNPVMGDAVINAYKLERIAVKGPLLFIDQKLISELNGSRVIFDRHCEEAYSVNWINSRDYETDKIMSVLGFGSSSSEIISEALEKYMMGNRLDGRWVESAKRLIEVDSKHTF